MNVWRDEALLSDAVRELILYIPTRCWIILAHPTPRRISSSLDALSPILSGGAFCRASCTHVRETQSAERVSCAGSTNARFARNCRKNVRSKCGKLTEKIKIKIIKGSEKCVRGVVTKVVCKCAQIEFADEARNSACHIAREVLLGDKLRVAAWRAGVSLRDEWVYYYTVIPGKTVKLHVSNSSFEPRCFIARALSLDLFVCLLFLRRISLRRRCTYCG